MNNFQSNEVDSNALVADTARPQINHTASPISNLHHDIVMQIFKINTSMNNDEPLKNKQPMERNTRRAFTTALNYSQVSFLWRDLIINSAGLWSNLIDLDAFNVIGEDFRQEILRRAQSAPLHVKGSIDLKSFDFSNEPWWLRLFNNHWERIRIFDVTLLDGVARSGMERLNIMFMLLDDAGTLGYREALPFLSRSTTNLESFRLKLPCACDPVKPGESLFGDHAPRLRSFHVETWPPNLTVQPYSWFSQLQNLDIQEDIGKTFASVDEVYQVLSQMPHLQSLCITDSIATSNIPNGKPALHLQFLNRIELYSANFGLGRHRSPAHFWKVLRFIIPKPGCSLRVMTSIVQSILDVDIDVLYQYAENYFNVNHPTKLKLSLSESGFMFTDVLPSGPRIPWNDRPTADELPFFEIDLSFVGDGSDICAMLYQLLETESLSKSFASVTELHFYATQTSIRVSTITRIQNLLSSFPSVEKLATHHLTLESLMSIPTSNTSIPTLFPRLKVLTMDLEPHGQNPEHRSPQCILKSFLNHRKDAGLPVSTFEYQPAPEPDATGRLDLACLDEFTGMTVVLPGKRIYICGTGKLEKLYFEEKFRTARQGRKRGPKGQGRRHRRFGLTDSSLHARFT